MPLSLRCLTLNLWGAEAPLEERMALVESGVSELAPDVVALQEVREVPGSLANQAKTLARATGMHVAFAPTVPFDGGHEGLAFLSRVPIIEHHATELPHATPDERRILLSARLATDASDVWVHTTHLNYRLHHGREREDQVLAIDGALMARQGERPQILMGDFNARPESDEIRFLSGLTTLGGRRTFYQDAWSLCHPHLAGWTWASANPYTERLAFLQPDRRIDYIFVTPRRRDGRGTILGCRMVMHTPSSNGIFPSDHFGLLAEIQIEPSAA